MWDWWISPIGFTIIINLSIDILSLFYEPFKIFSFSILLVYIRMYCDFGYQLSNLILDRWFNRYDLSGVTDEDNTMSCNRQYILNMCPNCQGESFFRFTLVLPSAASSWCPSSSSAPVNWWADDGLSGKHWLGPSTCLTVIFILELWMYLEQTDQSSSVSGSVTKDGETGCLASQQPFIFSAKLSGGAETMRGTAW